VRAYASYGQYVRHQQTKLETILRSGAGWLQEYEHEYEDVLKARLETGGHVRPGLRVLCLGARLGSEVRAFLALGCFAVGLDLNPGPKNQNVLYGDFHDLVWADASIDVVFTNALDHAFSIEKVLSEVRRVLVPGGLFLVEASVGTDRYAAGDFESVAWHGLDALVAAIESGGFTRVSQEPFSYPWPGEHLVFK
jgi:SAM-dependent methyltransferase